MKLVLFAIPFLLCQIQQSPLESWEEYTRQQRERQFEKSAQQKAAEFEEWNWWQKYQAMAEAQNAWAKAVNELLAERQKPALDFKARAQKREVVRKRWRELIKRWEKWEKLWPKEGKDE